MWDRNWAESYKSEEALTHPHRQLMLEVISRHEPFESVFEVGCAACANLYLLSKKYPEVSLLGYDISEDAIKKGYKLRSITAYSSLDKCFPSDIVLTDATAIYVSDKNIESFVTILKHYTKKAIILCEWHSDKGPFVKHGHWVHNYKELLPGCKITKLTEEDWPESSEWCEFGHIITYETS